MNEIYTIYKMVEKDDSKENLFRAWYLTKFLVEDWLKTLIFSIDDDYLELLAVVSEKVAPFKEEFAAKEKEMKERFNKMGINV